MILVGTIIAALLVVVSLNKNTDAQWTQTAGPPDEVTSLEVSGSDVFAGTDCGVYISMVSGGPMGSLPRVIDGTLPPMAWLELGSMCLPFDLAVGR